MSAGEQITYEEVFKIVGAGNPCVEQPHLPTSNRFHLINRAKKVALVVTETHELRLAPYDELQHTCCVHMGCLWVAHSLPSDERVFFLENQHSSLGGKRFLRAGARYDQFHLEFCHRSLGLSCHQSWMVVSCPHDKGKAWYVVNSEMHKSFLDADDIRTATLWRGKGSIQATILTNTSPLAGNIRWSFTDKDNVPKELLPPPPPPSPVKHKDVPCKFFAFSSCLKGEDCPYAHVPDEGVVSLPIRFFRSTKAEGGGEEENFERLNVAIGSDAFILWYNGQIERDWMMGSCLGVLRERDEANSIYSLSILSAGQRGGQGCLGFPPAGSNVATLKITNDSISLRLNFQWKGLHAGQFIVMEERGESEVPFSYLPRQDYKECLENGVGSFKARSER